MSKAIAYTIPGRPVPKARPRFKRSTGKPYPDPKAKAYENMVATESLRYSGQFTGPVRVSMWFAPKGVRVMVEDVEDVRVGLKADLDNLIKSLLDGMQKASVFTDDRQVQQIQAWFAPDLGENA